MVMQASYPNFRVSDKELTIKTWTGMLSDLSYEQVSKALQYFISTDTNGFAPSIGQIRASVQMTEPADGINESQAWAMVYNALCNSNYHAQEEFNRLPEDVRRAVGGAETLRSWAVMDEAAITVAESNFKRSFRAILESKKRDAMLPKEMRQALPEAPVARIEDKQEKEEVDRAKEEYVHNKLQNLFDQWGMS